MAMFNGGAAAAAPNTQALPETLADDLLEGADAIGAFLGWTQRQVYHRAAQRQFPHSKTGNVLLARKSTLLKWLTDQEEQCLEEGRRQKEVVAKKAAMKEVTRRPVRKRKGAAQ